MSVENVIALLEQLPDVSRIQTGADRVNSIAADVVRCVYDGRRTVAVGADPKTQINAFVDLVELHLQSPRAVGDVEVAPDEVVLLLVQDRWDTEAEGALRTLAARLQAPFTVILRRLNSHGHVLPISAGGLDDLGDHQKYRYTEWLRYLMDLGEQPPALVQRLLAGVSREEFRAYPMLTSKNWWSLRLEGLEVAQVGPRHGRLDVGRDYEGRRGSERTAWLDVVPEGRLAVVDDDSSVAQAAEVIRLFADRWDKASAGGTRHSEHALESRILRGRVPIHTSSGPLEVLRGNDHQRVSWGSQFPTRWGLTTSPSGRYLDGLLRSGSTPWALEIKISGSAGVASYYRHAVTQAVLYREFIQRATHLAPWFEQFELDHTACRAAVVVPEFAEQFGVWQGRLERMCAAFEVELVTVPEHFARAGQLAS